MPAMELLSGVRRREPRTHDSPEAPPEDFGEGEQPSPPSYELCDITYMTKFETSSGAKEGTGLRVWVMKSGRG